MVDKVQGDAKKLRDDIYAMDKGVSFLNSEVQELRSKERVHSERIKGLEDQIIYQELHNRRENLRLLSGVPESMADEEDTKEVIYQLLEKEVSIEEVREIEFQRIRRVGKKWVYLGVRTCELFLCFTSLVSFTGSYTEAEP